jgi:acetyl esterase/lipase
MLKVRELLDPECRPVMDGFQLPPLGPETLPAMRGGLLAAMQLELSDAVERTERLIPGDPPVRVRVHRESGATGTLPAILSLHGGGFVLGSYELDDPFFDHWCPKLGVVGISVEYRLAPESPYPGALDDAYAALRWAHEHADELGIDPDRIGLHGLSAGGGLAAGLALLARDRGELPVAFQALDSPMLDDRQVTASIQLDDLYVWSRESNAFGWRSYLGERYGAKEVPIYAAPSRATDLAGLPPAFVCVGSIDGFRDEDVNYAMKLNEAGVPCELHVYAGLPHGYVMLPDVAAVKLAAHNMEDWIARQLKRPDSD